MRDHQRLRKWLIALLATVVALLTGSSALAVPPQSALAPANNYGTVTATAVTPTAQEQATGITVCYVFTVVNTQPAGGLGIKGLIVYSPVKPVFISDPSRTSTTLYQQENGYSWWDHNGGADQNGNGLVDRYTEPGETNTGTNSGYTDIANLYRLCFAQVVDPSQFVYGLHVVEPFTGNTFFALSNPNSSPSLRLEKSVDKDCVAAGETVTYSYKVTNTGNVPITDLTITDDQLGVIGTIASLAPGASQTLTASTALMQTTTNVAQVSGKYGALTVTATSNPVTVQVSHPLIHVTLTASPSTACAGDSVTFTANVKNTGDVTLTNVVLHFSNGMDVNVGTLIPGATAGPFDVVITIPANQAPGTTYELKVTAQGAASVCGSPTTIKDKASVSVAIEKCAAICGTVFCIHDQNVLVSGATVQLLQNGMVVQATSTGPDGKFEFAQPIAEGQYTIRVLAADYETYASASFNYTHDGNDVCLSIGLKPLSINYRFKEQVCGRVFFSDVQTFRDREVPGQVLGQADLSNALYASPDSLKSYKYVGSIPGFPGHYGGMGEPEIWVIIQDPLVSSTDCSFANLVAVEDGVGTGAGRARSVYSTKVYFLQPFDGPGTAYHYTITGLETYSTPADGSLPANPMVSWSTEPVSGIVPPGTTATTIFTFRFKPGYLQMYAVGYFDDVCGERFYFRIHPDAELP